MPYLCYGRAYSFLGQIMEAWKQLELTRKANVSQAMKDMLNAVNGLDKEVVAEIMFEVLQGEHRTLQQSWMSALQKMLDRYGKMEYGDLRNEASREWAKAVSELTEKHYLPLI